jgi:hypothetical protein
MDPDELKRRVWIESVRIHNPVIFSVRHIPVLPDSVPGNLGKQKAQDNLNYIPVRAPNQKRISAVVWTPTTNLQV